MLRLLGLLLVIWLAITVIGAVVKGLFWLAVIGLRPEHAPPFARRPSGHA